MALAWGRRNRRGRGLPGCGRGGHRADFDEPEAQGRQGVDAHAILVQPGGQSHRVGEIQPHHAARADVRRGGQQSAQPAALKQIQAVQRQVVGVFRIEAEQQGTNQ